MIRSRVFRLFLSSTFTDFHAEREALRTNVFPRLEDFCARHGARFEVIDLRWGITEDVQKEHGTLQICLEEVQRSQRLSPRPNFVVFLGDRYGWEPIPAGIPLSDWEKIINVASDQDRAVLCDAYQDTPDLNSIPPLIYLKPQKGRGDGVGKSPEKVLSSLRRAIGSADLGHTDEEPYFASATHHEIALGALKTEDAKQHVHVYIRKIHDLPEHESAAAFIDWDSKKGGTVAGAAEKRSALQEKMRTLLGENVHDYTTRWNGAGVDLKYLDEFCEDFYEHQTLLIKSELLRTPSTSVFDTDRGAHETYAAESVSRFVGREQVLVRAENYLITDQNEVGPLVLLGRGGHGKSALISHLSQRCRDFSPGLSPNVIVRFIGVVPGVESLVGLLSDLVENISLLYSGNPVAPASEISELVLQFEQVIQMSTEEQPLWLFLDGLDQLVESVEARSLMWLPKCLPKNTRIVASSRTSVLSDSVITRFSDSMISLPNLTAREGADLLDVFLSEKSVLLNGFAAASPAQRTLTQEQRKLILAAFTQTRSALWMKLACEEASRWSSWDEPGSLPTSTNELIIRFVEKRLIQSGGHPRVFVEKALMYLSSARYGLSEEEIVRALGTDDEVRDEFFKNEKTDHKWDNTKVLPPIFWSRLYSDLRPFLGVISHNGAFLLRWFHTEFQDALKLRFFENSESHKRVHSHLAGVFEDLAPTELKFFEKTDASGFQVSRNLRRITEHPWQLYKAGEEAALVDLITSFWFCMAKAAANETRDLLSDFESAKALIKNDEKIKNWSSFLRNHGHLLDFGDDHWPGHRILLQFALEYQEESLIARSAEDWKRSGCIDWSYAVRTEPRELSHAFDGVDWKSFGDLLCDDGFSRRGLIFHREMLFGWDKQKILKFDINDGHAIRFIEFDGISDVFFAGSMLVVVSQNFCRVDAFHVFTRERKWSFNFDKSFNIVPSKIGILCVNKDSHCLLSTDNGEVIHAADYSNHAFGVASGCNSLVHVVGERWLVQLIEPERPAIDDLPFVKMHVRILDLHSAGSLVLSHDVPDEPLLKVPSAFGLACTVQFEENPIFFCGQKIFVWLGFILVFDVHAPNRNPRRIDAPKGFTGDYFVVQSGLSQDAHHAIFVGQSQLYAFDLECEQWLEASFPIGRALSYAWVDEGRLLIAGAFTNASGSYTYPTLLWNLEDNIVHCLLMPTTERWHVLTLSKDYVLFSRDPGYDTHYGLHEQPESLLVFDVRTESFEIIYTGIVAKAFKSAWLGSQSLAVIDDSRVVCLTLSKGTPWEEFNERSLGVLQTLTEDCDSASRVAIIGDRQVQIHDFGGLSPSVQRFPHTFAAGAVGELSGESLLIWEDDNGKSESGMPGVFCAWRKCSDGMWRVAEDFSDPGGPPCLIAEFPDFDTHGTYSMVCIGGIYLICQQGTIQSAIVNQGHPTEYTEIDCKRSSKIDNPFWVDGHFLYFQDDANSKSLYQLPVMDGVFGDFQQVPSSAVFPKGRIPFVNVRPYRDMTNGSMNNAHMFKIGDRVGEWSVADAATVEGQPKSYIEFTGADGSLIRWFGLKNCRVTPHRICYPKFENRDLFNATADVPPGDLYSIVVNQRLYFTSTADGTAAAIELIEIDSKK